MYFIHVEFIFVDGVRMWSSFIDFCMDLKDYLYLIVYFGLLCQILIDYKIVGVFLGSLFSSLDLYIYFSASTILFLLL